MYDVKIKWNYLIMLSDSENYRIYVMCRGHIHYLLNKNLISPYEKRKIFYA